MKLTFGSTWLRSAMSMYTTSTFFQVSGSKPWTYTDERNNHVRKHECQVLHKTVAFSHKHHALQYLHYPAVPCQVCATSRSWWGSFLSYTHSKTEIINEQTDKTITDRQTLECVLSHFTAAKVTVLSFTQTVSVCMCLCYTSTCLSCLFNHMTGCTRKSLKCVYTCEQCILTVITEVMQDRHKKKKII